MEKEIKKGIVKSVFIENGGFVLEIEEIDDVGGEIYRDDVGSTEL